MGKLEAGVMGFIIGAVVGAAETEIIYRCKHQLIPYRSMNYYNPRYIDTNELGIRLEDLDEDGIDEPILEYRGKSYLMRVNDDKVSLGEYEIKPAEKPEIVEKE